MLGLNYAFKTGTTCKWVMFLKTSFFKNTYYIKQITSFRRYWLKRRLYCHYSHVNDGHKNTCSVEWPRCTKQHNCSNAEERFSNVQDLVLVPLWSCKCSWKSWQPERHFKWLSARSSRRVYTSDFIRHCVRRAASLLSVLCVFKVKWLFDFCWYI